MMTAAEAKVVQGLFFGHPGGRILERELRLLGHIDTTLDTEEQRIEHNTVKCVLAMCGANIQLGRERIQVAEPPAGTEQDRILGVAE